jgi:hypothetical protein
MTQDDSKGFQRTLTLAAPCSIDPLLFPDADVAAVVVVAAVVGVPVQAVEGPVASSIENHCDLEFKKKVT